MKEYQSITVQLCYVKSQVLQNQCSVIESSDKSPRQSV